MDFIARVTEEMAYELMCAYWPENGLLVEIKSIEDTGKIKMALSESKFNDIQKTKVEYVEIPRGSVDIELIDEVFIDDAGEVSVRDASTAEFFTCSLYRRIETQITEREEFEIKFNDIRDRWDSSCDDFITLADFLYSNDCRFVGE